MKNRYFFICLFILFISVFLSCENEEKNDYTSLPVNVLYLGSSFTGSIYVYFDSLVFYNGDSIYKNIYTIGNGTLEAHHESDKTLKMISETDYDYILLQESGYRSAAPLNEIEEVTAPNLKFLIDTINKYCPKAKIGLFMTHAYKNGNPDRCNDDNVVCNFEGMQQRIIDNCLNLSERFGLELSPAGYYWKKFLEVHDSIELWVGDNSHPTRDGAYLESCIIYSVMYKKSPLGAPVPKYIKENRCKLIQEFVDERLPYLTQDWKSCYYELE
jgi:hypothetical protein